MGGYCREHRTASLQSFEEVFYQMKKRKGRNFSICISILFFTTFLNHGILFLLQYWLLYCRIISSKMYALKISSSRLSWETFSYLEIEKWLPVLFKKRISTKNIAILKKRISIKNIVILKNIQRIDRGLYV